MNKEAITRAIESLEMIRARPGMYLGAVTVEKASVYLSGFSAACGAFGCSFEPELRREATNKRGWTFASQGAIPDMSKKGLTEEQMVDELLLIDITVLQIMADRDE